MTSAHLYICNFRAAVEPYLCAVFFPGDMKNSTIIIKHPWESHIHSDRTIIFNGPEIISSTMENSSVWPIDVAIPNDANIRAKAQEKLEVLEALSNGGAIVRNENSCLLFPFFICTSRTAQTDII